MMRLSDFDYSLPDDLIAQQPAGRRDESRLMVVEPVSWAHLRFRDLGRFLAAGDLLVLNDTRVLPARLSGTLPGGGKAEVLLVEERAAGVWTALVRPGRKLRPGATVAFEGQSAHVEASGPAGERTLRFDGDPRALMRERGTLPLPPYIRETLADPERYQTVFAARPGAVAAPTAGLHFTPELLAALDAGGVSRATLTLHVGPGTFRPVQAEDLDRHRMHAERFEIPPATAAAVAEARRRGGRVVAVGTTVARALEAVTRADGSVPAMAGSTDLFILPGYRFRAFDALLTNFHLPRSTLLMLVAAFAEHAGLGGRTRVRAAYAEAIAERYRFYSFGDAMLLLPGR